MKDIMFLISKSKRIQAVILAVVVLITAIPLNMLVYGENGSGITTVSATLNVKDVDGNAVTDTVSYTYGVSGADEANKVAGNAEASDNGVVIALDGLSVNTEYTITIDEVKAVENVDGSDVEVEVVKYVSKEYTFITEATDYSGDIVLLQEAATIDANKVLVDVYKQLDFENTAAIDGVQKVTLQGNYNEQSYELQLSGDDHLDAKGEVYEISNVIYNQGTYTLTVVAEGYVTYIQDDISFADYDSLTPTDYDIEVAMTAKTVDSDFAYEESFTEHKVAITANTVAVRLPSGVAEEDIVRLGLTFDSSDATVATVASDGTITLVKTGATLITVTKAEDEDNLATDITYTLVVELAEQDELSFTILGTEENPYEVVYGTSDFQNIAQGGSVNGADITYASDNEDVATVTEDGTISVKGVGTAIIVASIAATDEYKEVSATFVIKVTEADNDGEFYYESSSMSETYKENKVVENTLINIITIDDAKVTYSSSNEDVALVDEQTGEVIIVGVGITVIEAINDGGVNYGSVGASYTLVVKYAQSIQINDDELEYNYEENLKIESPVVSDGDGEGTVVYTVASDPAGIVKSIDNATGEVVVRGLGTVVIKVTKSEANDSSYEDTETTYTIIVSAGKQDSFAFGQIGTSENPIAIEYNKPYVNTVSGGAGTGIISYSSSCDDIATVDANGNVTTIKTGIVKITATKAADSLYGEAIAEYYLKIIETEQNSMSFEAGNIDKYRDAEPFINKLTGGSGTGTVTYKSDNTNVATVASDGTVSICGVGTVIITATKAGDGNYKEKSCSYTIYVSLRAQDEFIFEIASPDNIQYSEGLTFSNVINPNKAGSNTGEDIVYKILNADGTKCEIATINAETGEITLTGKGVGTVQVTAFRDGGVYYEDASATYKLVIELGEQADLVFDDDIYEITDGNIHKVVYGDNYQNAVTGGTGNGSITYTSSNTEYITVDSDGKLTLKKSTYNKIDDNTDDIIVTITAVKSGAGLYNDETATYKLVVDRASQSDSLGFHKDNTSVNLGTAFQNTLVNSLGEGAISYSSNKESVAKVDADGNLTTYTIGTVTITAEKAADDCYYGGKLSYTIDVRYDETIGDTAYTISGTKGKKATDDCIWYIGNVKITAADGYMLSMMPKVDGDADWSADLLEVADYTLVEGMNKVTIYVKRNSDSAVSAAIEVVIYKDSVKADITTVINTQASNGRYNGDVEVEIQGNDATSNIAKIEYVVTNGGSETDKGEWIPDGSVETFGNTITIDSSKNNSDNIIITVAVTDKAGNVETKTLPLKIDIDKPEISVVYDNNSPYMTVDGNGYYPNARIATVTIIERASNFNATKATNSIMITAVKADGSTVELDNIIGTWKQDETNENIHTADISFVTDANYTLSISYIDEAGNVSEEVDYGESETPTAFAVDTVKPIGTVAIGNITDWDWSVLLGTFTFNRWTNLAAPVAITSADATTPIKSVEYYLTDGSKIYAEEELLNDVEWTDFDSLMLANNKRSVVYVKVTDFAGNYAFICSNGIVTDNMLPTLTLSVPEVNNDIYNNDVTITVKTEDIAVNNVMSGIGSITYEVLNMNNITQTGTLFTHDTSKDIVSSSEDHTIIVDKTKNNSNNVMIRVTVKDNAGNQVVGALSVKIDTVAPTISVNYDNNAGDTTFAASTYFNDTRVATIEVTERNFDVENTIITIQNSDGVQPVISNWTKVNGTGNGDDTIYRATVTYATDGDYEFGITTTDLASNKMTSAVDYGHTLAPTEFTIDKTVPVVNVTYDNNTFINGNYYNAERTATIAITEHNFETSRLVIELSATDDGDSITLPTVSNWTTDGDVHRATISYSADGLYTFDLSYTDMAGNVAAEFEAQEFYVDKTEPTLEIVGVSDNAAYNTEGNVTITVTAKDTNFDQFVPVLSTLVKTEKGYTSKQVEADIVNITNGKTFKVVNLVDDGIYSLTCTLVDKAGNEYTKILLVDIGGDTYEVEKTSADVLMTFSVNREGSTYDIDENTMSVVDKYYVKNLVEDLVIYEVNVDPLTSYTIKLNGQLLVEGEDYRVDSSANETGSWYKYGYVIFKDNFVNEGEYSIVIESTDKAGTTAYSDIKKTDISFVVDKTEPTVTLSGLSENGRYQVLEQTVTAVLTDDGGKVQSFKVIALDANEQPLKNDAGEDISVRFDMSGEELTTYLNENGGKITFTIPECVNAIIRVYCSDYASGDGDETNVATLEFKGVTISQSGMVIFYANQPLFWGSIIGAICLVVVVIILIVVAKKKKKSK